MILIQFSYGDNYLLSEKDYFKLAKVMLRAKKINGVDYKDGGYAAIGIQALGIIPRAQVVPDDLPELLEEGITLNVPHMQAYLKERGIEFDI